MTTWQKISAVLGRVADEPSEWDDRAVEFSLIPQLATMVKDGDNIIVAVPENFGGENQELSLVENETGKYVLAFPDKKAAEIVGENVAVLPAEEVFRAISKNEEIAGIRLVYRIHMAEKTFMASAIVRHCILSALELGLAARKKDQPSE